MNLPTKITIARILLIPVFVAFFFLCDYVPYNRLIAAGIFAVAAFTDWVDGFLARKLNQVTDLGKFLDPIADKLLVMCALLAILACPREDFQVTMAVMAMIILSREFIVSAFRIIAAGKDIKLAADRLGKIKTVLQMAALLILIPMSDIIYITSSSGNAVEIFGIILLGGATIMTVISGINYIVMNREVLKTSDNNNAEQ